MEEIPIKAPKFSLEGLSFRGRVVSVYDGDTVKVIFKFRGVYNVWNCRILGIDTPELRTRDLNEKRAAQRARDYLREIILNKIVNINCNKFDKYGRLLVEIKSGSIKNCNVAEGDNLDIGQHMIDLGHAQSYDGGTKKKFNLKKKIILK